MLAAVAVAITQLDLLLAQVVPEVVALEVMLIK